jgi:hypothetical protein
MDSEGCSRAAKFYLRKWKKEASRIGIGSSYGDIGIIGSHSEVFMKMWELGEDEKLVFRKGSILKCEGSAKLCDVSHMGTVYSTRPVSLALM